MDRSASNSAADNRLERIQQIVEEVIQRRNEGESLPDEEVVAQHPELLPELKLKLERLAFYEQLPNGPPSEDAHSQETPSFGTTVDGEFGRQGEDQEEPLPESIGRYTVRGPLGGGGFGTVYLGYDADLEREVAIKVPRPDRIREPADVEAYLAEARLVAGLDHPHIVPVHDVGHTEDGRCFIVSKRIDGSDLRERMPLFEKDYPAIAQLVATIAEALHYAHGKDITHRDIKPENILIDAAGQPHVADFGLALKEEKFGEGSGYAGTPLYWSPEQARGEGHRVDGRSDIFSLGVVLYELLTAKRPFKGSSPPELAESISTREVRPPRMIKDKIPKELERICLKALSKRATDRYTTARDMAEDLQHFLAAGKRPSTPAGAPLRRIFISYRRNDTGELVEQLAEELRQRYGTDAVFLDMATIPYGADFRDGILHAIQRCDVLLAVIGSEWSGTVEGSGRRIDDPEDLVRVEIETALTHGTPIVPVLAEQAQMPGKQDLPSSLTPLPKLNACPLEAGSDFSDHAARLMERLDAIDPWAKKSPGPSTETPPTPPVTPIVPKGLRSFETEDAGFFLELLPGPRDRDGLPESIRFWKTRIEETDPDQTFAVGLIYGPSGCGKSSLMKAGLLPRLAGHVVPVYVEATPTDTESRLLRRLQKQCPDLPRDEGLAHTLATLRRGRDDGKKVVLVIDQFEQWLHAHREERETELVRALRHCDGEQLQAVVLVRDDFWMPVTSFFDELEISLVQHHNALAVDLFDTLHARRVLTEFGHAYGRLPASDAEFSETNVRFLDRAVEELAEEGKVICVRLALFAQMVQGKPWEAATIEDLGGAAGIGVRFLDDTFIGSSASPRHRLYQRQARAVLKALLPATETGIKGARKPYEDLREAAGKIPATGSFDELLKILDRDLRLITPSTAAGEELEDDSATTSGPEKQQYQLTHDYLVPSLRKWLTQKQMETRRGRAELRLAERAALWNAKTEKARLPALWEFVSILALTRRRDWTEPQRGMMSAATRYFSLRFAAVAVLVAVLACGGYELNGRFQAAALVENLVDAGPETVAETAQELQEYLRWAKPDLRELASMEPRDPKQARQQLHARLSLVATDDSQVDPLVETLLTAPPGYVGVIRDALRPYRGRVVQQLQPELGSSGIDRRFRATIAMVGYTTEEWTEEDFRFLAEQILLENPKDQPVWLSYVERVKDKCIPHWERVFADKEATDLQLLGAANAIAEFASDDQERIASLLTIATPKQYEILFDKLLDSNPDDVTKISLAEVAAKLPPDEMSSEDRIAHGQRRAGAGITLLRLGERQSVLPTFDVTDDPEAVAQFIHRCYDRGVQARELLECLRTTDPRKLQPEVLSLARYALLLALAEYLPADIPAADRELLIGDIANWYANDPSSAVHGAAGWLLRAWGEGEIVRQVDQTPVDYSPDREWFTLTITVTSPGREYATRNAEGDSESRQNDPESPPQSDEPSESSDDEKPAAEGSTPDTESGEEGDNGKEGAEDTAEAAAPEEASDESAPSESEQPQFAPQTFYYTFVVFAAGDYHIGSMSGELDRQNNETRHKVPIDRPFALLDRELTFAELIAFDPKFGGFMPQYNANPADAAFGADWYDAAAFCRWLTEQSGLGEEAQPYPSPASLDPERFPREPDPRANWAPRNWPLRVDRPGFRLPNEAEWEVACRGGMRTAYGEGSDVDLLQHYAWYVENSGKHVHPPKMCQPGPRGLFDMHGNLWESCHDWYGSYPAPRPTGPPTGSSRVYRGGGWYDVAADCRASNRRNIVPANRTRSLGFRLALVPSSKEE